MLTIENFTTKIPEFIMEDDNTSLPVWSDNNNTSFNNSGCVVHADSIYTFLVGGVGVTTVCFLGIIGNTLTALVLSRPSMRSSVNIILLGLSICDLVFVTISLMFYGVAGIFQYFCFLQQYNDIILPFMVPPLFPLISVAQLGSVYFTVCVTVERFLVVHFPMRARSWCTVNHATTVSVLIVIFSILYNLPTWWEYTYVERSMNGTLVAYDLALTSMRKDPMYVLYYVNWSSFFIFRLIPFVTLVVLNIGIYVKVREANKMRKTMTQSQTHEISIAKMLVCIVATFLLCNVMALALNMRESFTGAIASDELITLSSLFIAFNSAINFVIYCFMGKKFRSTCVQMIFFCFTCGKRPESPSKLYISATSTTDFNRV